jgi:topoisomerase-4 subunit A
LGDNKENKLIWFSQTPYPRIQVMFGGADAFREPLVLELDEFIGTKSFKARGKRLTPYTIDEIIELDPTRQPEPPAQPTMAEGEAEEDDSDSAVQLNLFEEE